MPTNHHNAIQEQTMENILKFSFVNCVAYKYYNFKCFRPNIKLFTECFFQKAVAVNHKVGINVLISEKAII